MKEHRFSLPFTSFGALNFSDESILHKAIFLSGEGVDQIAKFVIEKGRLAKESDNLIR